jgi:iron complex transport system substrate-binding protein
MMTFFRAADTMLQGSLVSSALAKGYGLIVKFLNRQIFKSSHPSTALLLQRLAFLLLLCLSACSTPVAEERTEEAQETTKVELKEAKNFSIERQGKLILLKIGQAWPEAKEQFSYVLYPREEEAPRGFPNAIKIAIPVERIICTGTTQIAMLDALGASDKIVGLTNGQYLYNPALRKRLAAGELVDLGNDQSFNYEKLLQANPDLVFSFSIGNTQQLKKIQDLGLPAVLLSEFMEESPLGRAEWMRFIACFIGKEELAEAKFDSLYQNYQNLKKELKQIAEKPTVFTGVAQQGAWYVAGGQSFVSKFIQDAGGEYLWADNEARGGLPLDFEVVLNKAEKADVWLNVVLAQDLEQLKGMDERYSLFQAHQQQQVYSYTARVSENGGYDFFESAIVRPDLVLKDLIRIFHPQLLPENQLYYYKKLN